MRTLGTHQMHEVLVHYARSNRYARNAARDGRDIACQHVWRRDTMDCVNEIVTCACMQEWANSIQSRASLGYSASHRHDDIKGGINQWLLKWVIGGGVRGHTAVISSMEF